ncbi:glutamine--tRNA ligase, cytoplasmic-like [Brassica napus]|uniref:glutamine--tRNA ligase, cytoplasmic-like n=1 Tax=Brassica napus TaxID=3708 RepID=UPI000BBEFE59|nr:glutamine--tRNA ligase, cytoplasmic-like [Brassica napus]
MRSNYWKSVVHVSFFDNHAPENFKLNEFEEACSVGVEVSAEDIEKAADEVFEKNKKTIVEQRYRTNVGQLLGHVRKSLPWADPKIVKDVIDRKMYELQTAADNEQSSLDEQETE